MGTTTSTHPTDRLLSLNGKSTNPSVWADSLANPAGMPRQNPTFDAKKTAPSSVDGGWCGGLSSEQSGARGRTVLAPLKAEHSLPNRQIEEGVVVWLYMVVIFWQAMHSGSFIRRYFGGRLNGLFRGRSSQATKPCTW